MITSSMLKYVARLFYPLLCAVCQNTLIGNSPICAPCASLLEEISYNKKHPLKERLSEQINISHAFALFYYTNQSIAQYLIHELKYRKHQRIGIWLGEIMAGYIKNYFAVKNNQVLIPVPLHKKRQRKRGYNQAELICQGIKKQHPEIAIDTHSLIRKNFRISQAMSKSKENRIFNIKNAFDITPQATKNLAKKNIILVDDVCTTGATLSACYEQLNKIPQCQINIAVACMSI